MQQSPILLLNGKNELTCGTRTAKGRPKLRVMCKCLLVLWVILTKHFIIHHFSLVK